MVQWPSFIRGGRTRAITNPLRELDITPMASLEPTIPTIEICFFERKSEPGTYSLERVFSDVREHLPTGVTARVLKCPYESIGFLNRLRNVLWARNNAGDINHITGDVHYLALLLPRNKTILTIHDCVAIVRHGGIRQWALRFFWYRLPISRAAVVTVISEFTKRELLSHVKVHSHQLHVVYNPCSPAFKPKTKPFSAIEPIILQVGTWWNKNLSRVAEALRGIHCRLEIVGPLDSRQRDELRANAITYRNHEWVSDEELVALYQGCDLVIFASTYEGFGLPIVEAQAVGRPIITSNTCSMPEVAGEAACLVDPFDTQSIRDGISRIIGDEAYRGMLVEKGFENIKRFDPVRIASQYADLYRLVAQDSL